jgi:hypothetical protein
MPELSELHQAIVRDQFEWGEFGVSEDSTRSEEESLAKPNFFISCHAAFALVATGGSDSDALQGVGAA